MHALTTEQISELIGRNFYDVFKPIANSETALETAMKRLENGAEPEDIFDECNFNEYYNSGLMPVCLHKKCNILDDRKLLLKQWFDNIVISLDEEFSHISILVELGNKWNIISLNDGETLEYNQWFDRINIDYNSGYNVVELNGKCNFIDSQGNYLSNQWFNNVNFFHEGYARVKLNDKWNLIDEQGNYLFKQWFDIVDNFYEGYAKVKLNSKYNFIDIQGNYLSKQWFDSAYKFKKDGYASVELNDEWNLIDRQGNYLYKTWVDFLQLRSDKPRIKKATKISQE